MTIVELRTLKAESRTELMPPGSKPENSDHTTTKFGWFEITAADKPTGKVEPEFTRYEEAAATIVGIASRTMLTSATLELGGSRWSAEFETDTVKTNLALWSAVMPEVKAFARIVIVESALDF